MSSNRIGDLAIEDYLAMTGQARKRRPGFVRLLKVVGLALGATLCVAAGDYVGPWTGKHTLALPFDEGLRTLGSNAPEPMLRTAIGVSYRGAEQAVDLLGRRARDPGKVGVYSRVALANAAQQSLTRLVALQRDSVQEAEVRADLQRLYSSFKRECPWLQ